MSTTLEDLAREVAELKAQSREMLTLLRSQNLPPQTDFDIRMQAAKTLDRINRKHRGRSK